MGNCVQGSSGQKDLDDCPTSPAAVEFHDLKLLAASNATPCKPSPVVATSANPSSGGVDGKVVSQSQQPEQPERLPQEGVDSIPKQATVLDSDMSVSSASVSAHSDQDFWDQKALEAGAAGLPHDICTFGAPRAPNEEQRMATIKAMKHMDLNSCPELNRILKVICDVYEAPSSSVTLLDSEHVWICNAEGMDPCHKPWGIAMCPWMLLDPHPTTLAVGELSQDARFSENVHAKSGTRSYLTAPLVASNGHRLGAICFTDTKPRKFDAGDARMMNNFAELAVREIEKHAGIARRLEEDQIEENEPALREAYMRPVRDFELLESACVALLDTSVPGWKILYASPCWEDWTGLPRDDALGKTMDGLLEHVHADNQVVWKGMEQDVAAGASFVTAKVQAKGSNGSLHFYLSFKPAALDVMDEDTVPIGIPCSLPMDTKPQSKRFYFARLHRLEESTDVLSTSRERRCSVVLSASRRLPPSMQVSPMQGCMQLLDGLEPGQVLGQGGFGTVYHAKWHGTNVAVKVQDYRIRNAKEREKAELEVSLGEQLMHENIVRTVAHASSILDGKAYSMDDSSVASWMQMEMPANSGSITPAALSGPCDIITQNFQVLPTVLEDPAKHGEGEDAEDIYPGHKGMDSRAEAQGHHAQADAGEHPDADADADGHADADADMHADAAHRDWTSQGPAAAAVIGNLPSLQALQKAGLSNTSNVSNVEITASNLARVTSHSSSSGVHSGGIKQGSGTISSMLDHGSDGDQSRGDHTATAKPHARFADKDAEALDAAAPAGAVPMAGDTGNGNFTFLPNSGGGFIYQPVWHTIGTYNEQTQQVEDGALINMLSRKSTGRLADGSNSGGRLSNSGRASAVLGRENGSVAASNFSFDLLIEYPVTVRVWMFMEFMDHGNLQEAADRGWLRHGRSQSSPIILHSVLTTAMEIASALAHLHKEGIVHGDLSAVNVMLKSAPKDLDGTGRGFVAKVADFGMSLRLKPAQKMVSIGSYGTVTHMAPEVLGRHQLGKPGDIYSFGVLLWQMMTGSRPWAGMSHAQILYAVSVDKKRLVYPDHVHAGIKALGERCCSDDPEARPTIDEVILELTKFMNYQPQSW